MAQGLFRREVLDQKQTGWMGGFSLAQPVNLRVLSAAAVIVALLVLLYLTFGTYTRRTRVTGQLVPAQGLATVLAPATGVVSRIDVVEGGKAKTGQMLAIVTVPKATLANGETASALSTRIQPATVDPGGGPFNADPDCASRATEDRKRNRHPARSGAHRQ